MCYIQQKGMFNFNADMHDICGDYGNELVPYDDSGLHAGYYG
jgi:hypothetical protein